MIQYRYTFAEGKIYLAGSKFEIQSLNHSEIRLYGKHLPDPSEVDTDMQLIDLDQNSASSHIFSCEIFTDLDEPINAALANLYNLCGKSNNFNLTIHNDEKAKQFYLTSGEAIFLKPPIIHDFYDTLRALESTGRKWEIDFKCQGKIWIPG